MIPMIPAILLCLLLPAQDKPASDKLLVKLSVPGGYMTPGDPLPVKIEVHAKADTWLKAGLITGNAIEVWVAGKKLGSVGKTSKTKVRFPKGAHMAVEMPIDLSGILKRAGARPTAAKPVEIELGLPGGARSKISVVPDFKKVDIDKLDLTKTRVALVTNFGTMVVAFRPDLAPKTVRSFVKLSRDGFYDGTRFHRVLKGFMIQGGDPNTKDDDPSNDGTGGPGYSLKAEFNNLKHVRGILSMARSQDPDSAGSQFFVMHGLSPHLDGKYTGFGSLVDGLDALDRIANVEVKARSGQMERSVPTTQVWLHRAVVLGVLK